MDRHGIWRVGRASGGVAAVLVLQYLLVAIPKIEPVLFDRRVVELQRSDSRRYGYVMQRHGAVLVRTTLDADAAPFVPPRDDRVATLMTRELKTTPWKAAIELAFYASLVALGRSALRTAPWMRAAPRRRLRLSLGAGLSAIVFVSAVVAPYLAIGYGEPLFSTRRGPGALTSSGLVPVTAPIVPAVSYGLILEAFLIWPMMAMQWAAEPLSAWLGIRGSLWVVAAGFWAVVATVATWWANLPVPLKDRGR